MIQYIECCVFVSLITGLLVNCFIKEPHHLLVLVYYLPDCPNCTPRLQHLSVFQTLLSPQVWDDYPGVRDFVMKFLAPGLWEKHKSDLARKVGYSN